MKIIAIFEIDTEGMSISEREIIYEIESEIERLNLLVDNPNHNESEPESDSNPLNIALSISVDEVMTAQNRLHINADGNNTQYTF